MSDMIPATRIIAVATARAVTARACLDSVSAYSHTTDNLTTAKAALDVAIELLELAAEPEPQTVSYEPMPNLNERVLGQIGKHIAAYNKDARHE